MTTDKITALITDIARCAKILDRISAGRFDNTEDIVGALLFLSSKASDYVNGTVMPANDGWMGR